MIIERVDPNQAVFEDYHLEGNILTIGGIELDLATEQGGQQVIITFTHCNGMIHRGMMPCCTYAAEVLIPPRRYETVEAADEAQEGESGQRTHIESVPMPLDTDCVVLKLWPRISRREEGEGGL
ncbi:MAG: hypothetical protein LBD55_03560 [Treponema sp.]|jgi:hypothetical protein|nr:hypothetical protein [Treponema sp.]